MFRRPASFALLVIGLLLLQWTLGSPPGLRVGHGVGAIGVAQICSVAGTKSDTAPTPPEPGSAGGEACCWAGPGPTLLPVTRATPVSVPIAYATALAMAEPPGLPVPPALRSKPQPRAPPVVA
jgi:hypothetical protein